MHILARVTYPLESDILARVITILPYCCTFEAEYGTSIHWNTHVLWDAAIGCCNSQASNYTDSLGYSPWEVQRRPSQEGPAVSVRSLQRPCSKFNKKHTIQDPPRATKPRLLTPEMLLTIEDRLRNDDELTARKLKAKLCEKFTNFLTCH